MEERILKSKVDNWNIHFYTYPSKTDEKAIIQIVHGMSEHSKRYEWAIEKFTENGYKVYIHDHRGHGKSVNTKPGDMGDGDGFLKMLRDIRSINKIIRQENPNKKIIILAHSMGSFLIQRYIQIYSDTLDGVILSGTGGNDNLLTYRFSKIFAKMNMYLNGKHNYGKTIETLMTLNCLKKIKDKKTVVDWLTTDEQEIYKYLNDENCGFPFTTSAYYNLFKGISENFDSENLKRINKDLPILIISGDKDPIGNYGKGIKSLEKTYKKYNIKNITVKLYPEKRHEILNETNKEEVMQDILQWLKQI